MVSSDLKRHPLPDGFDSKVVAEALCRAAEAQSRRDRRELVTQCDVALKAPR